MRAQAERGSSIQMVRDEIESQYGEP
jgi:hypothetical protein